MAYSSGPGKVFKVKVTLDDRSRVLTTGTADATLATAVGTALRNLRTRADHDDAARAILTALLDGRTGTAEVYRHVTAGSLGDLVRSLAIAADDIDVEPYVTLWHKEKARGTKGASSADRYLRQLRLYMPKGVPLMRSAFTRRAVWAHLDGLAVASDGTRNRHKAAIASFAKWLVKRDLIDGNPVREIEGYAESEGHAQWYERADAQRLVAAQPQPYAAVAALMCGGGLEWQAIERLTARDVVLVPAVGEVRARGGKFPWRDRTVRIIPENGWTLAYIRPALAGRIGGALVFPGVTNSHAYRAHLSAVAALGLTRSTLHDWRHTHAVQLLRDGYSLQVAAHQLGHRDTTLVQKLYGRYIPSEIDYTPRHVRGADPLARTVGVL